MTPRPDRRRRSQGRRPARPRADKGASVVGQRFEAEVGPVAHGGHCVARVPVGDPGDLRVVFVRHALPGERVEIEVTEGAEQDRFWRGDAVRVLSAAPGRVEAPCRFAGPGLCGGCDFQHVDLATQRALKGSVVTEQLRRLAGLERDVVVEQMPGDQDGLRWRTRTRFVGLPGGARGMRVHRSHDVVEVDDCLIARPGADVLPEGPTVVESVTAGGVTHEFVRAADGFWQTHPGAAQVLVTTVLDMLAPQPGEKVLDLYAGVGLFARFLADAVGEGARVVAVEGEPTASKLSRDNLAVHRAARAVHGDVAAVLREQLDEPFDLVVLDPPREGAKRAVVEQVVDRAPRAVAYVACDPAALARDVALFAERGYRLADLRAFDLFPMTHHVECVALLTKAGSDLR